MNRNQKIVKSGASSKSAQKKKIPERSKERPRVLAPLAQSRPMRTGNPSVSGSPYSGDGRVRIRHREYLRDVSGSVNFSANLIPINPGLSTVFPWLSVMAANFESYLFHKLSFDFETQKSASTSGSIMMAVDYDASDAIPVNKQQLMAYHNAVRSAVWAECSFRGDRPDLMKFGQQRFVRSGAPAANLDIKTYDVGNLVVATQGEADTSAIGELYVDYDVELITPQFNVDLISSNSVRVNSGSSTSRANPFTNVTLIGGLPVAASVATLTFNKPGVYLMDYIFGGTVVTNTLPTYSGTAAITSPSASQYVDAAATSGQGLGIVTVTDVGQTVTFDFTASCATLTTCNVRIAPYNNG